MLIWTSKRPLKNLLWHFLCSETADLSLQPKKDSYHSAWITLKLQYVHDNPQRPKIHWAIIRLSCYYFRRKKHWSTTCSCHQRIARNFSKTKVSNFEDSRFIARRPKNVLRLNIFNFYFDISMNYSFGMTVCQCVSKGFHDFTDLYLVLRFMKILFITEFPSFHILHHNIEIIFIIINFIDLNYIRMFQLDHQ